MLAYSMFHGTTSPQKVPLSQVITMSQNRELNKIEIDQETMLVTTTDGRQLQTAIGNLSLKDLEDLGLVLPRGRLRDKGVERDRLGQPDAQHPADTVPRPSCFSSSSGRRAVPITRR